ncbi:MAG: hypothetical protein JO281_22035 [Pseudonocardiales bacterium]|nr:hypothetical protein [Pseudonocardiales bacterium]
MMRPRCAYRRIVSALVAADSCTAIGIMFQLYPDAAPIIVTPLPDGSGNHGPDFIPHAH